MGMQFQQVTPGRSAARPGALRWIGAWILALCLAGCDDGSSAPADSEDPANRAWVTEAEILADPSLEVSPRQVVVLHLSAARLGDAASRHVIPYRFDEATTYNFCIPEEDAHIHSAELFERGSPTPLFQLSAGGGCETHTIAPGSYHFVIQHDGRGVAAAGEVAFLHVPRLTEEPAPVAAGAPVAVSPGGVTSCDALAVLTTSNGKYLTRGSGPPYPSVATATDVDLAIGGWQVCRDANGAYELFLAGAAPQLLLDGKFGAQAMWAESDGRITVHDNSVSPYATPFDFVDLGDFQFQWWTATVSGGQANPALPLVVGTDGTLRWSGSASPQVYGMPVKYYLPGVEPPPLQPGEVSLQHSCSTEHGTWVVRADLADATDVYYLNPQLGTRELLGASTSGILVRVGPDTVASFYALSGYRGLIENIGGDVCGTDFDQFGSLKISTARDFIIANNYCRGCNLSGLDLSGLDLTDGFYRASTFTGANLMGTNLTLADLSLANLSGPEVLLAGTILTDSFLGSANLRGADLTGALARSNLDGVMSTLTQRADLTGAILDVDTFLPADWRFFNLTGATITNVQCKNAAGACLPCEPVSSGTDRVNFSGGIFNGVDFSCSILDGGIFDCDDTEGPNICTQLVGTNLNHASLKGASFVDANLQGARLDFANLDSANLCSSKLNQSPELQRSASLQGAYLRNVNLYQADLTGAVLDNVNFYSTDTSGICNGASCAPTRCATAAFATLNGTSFTHAYLSGTDFSDASFQGVNFVDAFLLGANFTKANLSGDPNLGRFANFRGAFLQGANMSTASVTYASFDTAYVDTRSSSATVKLEPDNTKFAGFAPSSSTAAGCVRFTYPNASATPRTDDTNTCPNGTVRTSGCAASDWVLPTPTPGCSSVDFNWGAVPTPLPTLTPYPD